jgi:prepilin-type N-terminal cleavage/methylation domain-containing protein
MSRSGFSLIELMIVLAIIGLLSTVSFSTYQVTKERLLTQNQIARVEENLKQGRNIALSQKSETLISTGTGPLDEDLESESSNAGVVAFFDFDDVQNRINRISVYKNLDLNLITDLDVQEEVISELVLDEENGLLIIPEINLKSVEIDTAASGVIDSISDDFYITFSKSTGCNYYDSLLEEVENPLLQIPMGRINEDNEFQTIRYLYMHKIACNPEILIDNYFEDEA